MARVLRILLGLFPLVAFAAMAQNEASPTLALTILHTSDLHGSVLPIDDVRNRPSHHSLAQIATLVKTIRTQSEHPVLVLDSGDTIQGTPFEYFSTLRHGRPSPTIEVMNRIGYQAMAVGNHEFNFGLELLRKAQIEADFPFLSANTIDISTGEASFDPYRIIELESVRVGILGLTTSNVSAWERPENYRGLRFETMDESARRWVHHLRHEEHCNLIIVLAHTGFEKALESGESTGTEAEDFAWRLSQIPGIDLLLTGHTHDNISPRLLNQTIVSQPASHARVVTRIDLELVEDDEGWQIASWQGDNVEVRNYESDSGIEEDLAEAHSEVEAALDQPIAVIDAPLSVAGCRVGDCAALDLIHAVQLDATGADLSLAAILSDRTPDLPAGPVTWRWVYGFYVYPNTLVAVRVTGQQIKDILEHIAGYYNGLDCSQGPGCEIITDPSIARYNVDTMAGLSYRIDPTQPQGSRIRDLVFAGEDLDLHQNFILACNNYRRAGGGDFPHLQNAPVVWAASTEMADLIGAYLEAQVLWSPEADDNWRIEPEFHEQ